MSDTHPSYGAQKMLVTKHDPECQPYESDTYTPPTPDQMRAVLSHRDHWTGSIAGKKLGVDARTIRKWIGGETKIPYAAWRLLLALKGIIKIETE